MTKLVDKLRAQLDGRAVGGDFGAYADDPVTFAGEVLGLVVIEYQAKVLRAIAAGSRVAVAAGHRTGRTMAFAIAMLWWCSTRTAARALLSTPSNLQMRSTIWRQVAELIRNARRPLGVVCHELPSRGAQFDSGNEIIGIASDTGERLQGFAAANLLIVVDEAAGYPEQLFPSLMSNLAGGGRALVGGNPTKNTGTFAECFTKNARRWTTMHVSALDVARSGAHAAGLATEEWCQEMLEEHGAESIVYRARVLGEFSERNEFAMFSLTELELAQDRFDDVMAGGPRVFDGAGALELGVDVARSGEDLTVVVARRGHIALPPQAWKIPDLVAVSERVRSYALELARVGERPTVRVDGVGVGAGVVDVLKRDGHVRVVEVQAAAAPQRDAYTNVRSEAAHVARDWLRGGGCLPRDAKLEGEMAALTYCFDIRNRLKILSKDELRRQLGRSTDRFDALALAVYTPTVKRASLVGWSGRELGVPQRRCTGFGDFSDFWKPVR